MFFSKKSEVQVEEFYPIEQEEEENVDEEKEEENETILIHIMGEVQNEGIVEIKKGSRVQDAIDMAGGLKENADLTDVNLAFVLEDGMKVIIPSFEENLEKEYITGESGENVIGSLNDKGGSKVININTASQEELESLPGIGSAIALRIIAYREENGTFNSIEDIKNVSGIGDSKFNNIKDLICV